MQTVSNVIILATVFLDMVNNALRCYLYRDLDITWLKLVGSKKGITSRPYVFEEHQILL